jgi:DNA-binding CsgD family transcriptional regulator
VDDFLASELFADAVRIASVPGNAARRGEQMLDALRRLVPFQAGWLGLLDAERGRLVGLSGRGPVEPLEDYFALPEAMAEVELLGLRRPGPPMRAGDLPVPVAEVRAWADFLWPAGFREGVATPLVTADGRLVGYLSLLTDAPAHPSPAAVEAIGRLATLVADVADPLRSIQGIARVVQDARAGTILTRSGATAPLPGLPGHPLLAPGSRVIAEAGRQLAAGAWHVSFLCPGEAGWHRITVLAAPQPVTHLLGLVTVSPPGEVHGLSRRELTILGLLLEGWPRRRVALALRIPAQAVTGALERVRVKLGAATTTGAIMRAMRTGLYVPGGLTGLRATRGAAG